MAIDPGGIAEVSAWLEGQAERVIETHAAKVFLVGQRAYKLKKAVDLGYLDFSTPQKRAAVLARELELNKPGAPDIYRSVRRITRAPGGCLEFDGAGEFLEAVLEMRRFDPDAVLSNRPETVQGDFAEALGRRVARFHAQAERKTTGGAEAARFVAGSNAEHLRALEALRGERAEAVIAATDAKIGRLAGLLDGRRDEGFVRRCHGDLHLGNIFVEPDGTPVLFDCIEFNDRLAEIDVLYDLAFLVMDLCFRGQREGACRVLNGYFDEAARAVPEPWAGLRAMPLFLSMRAVVRAHVSAQMKLPDLARDYLSAGAEHLKPAPAVLAAVGGVSGTGKTTVARALAPALGACPGAVVLRSDEVRKRLWDVPPTEKLPQTAYGPGQSERVYGLMLEEAEACLRAGRAVILDAVFQRPEERRGAEALAAKLRLEFLGAWLEAPVEVLRARVAGRRGDASDADVAVLNAQLDRDCGPIDWMRLDAREPAAAAAGRILRQGSR